MIPDTIESNELKVKVNKIYCAVKYVAQKETILAIKYQNLPIDNGVLILQFNSVNFNQSWSKLTAFAR
ncbi:hypothetical protein BpHYR1_007882 [Brachionus plicatilis]|uniref:Uncharacterized protein n=1 Tax=Brachionus plicatilis TaxID=10195 RepID=A0A3M7S656_BRAPC|nr:hypothetical protein BpHYR1_007882 [Brachionus plicatilis]